MCVGPEFARCVQKKKYASSGAQSNLNLLNTYPFSVLRGLNACSSGPCYISGQPESQQRYEGGAAAGKRPKKKHQAQSQFFNLSLALAGRSRRPGAADTFRSVCVSVFISPTHKRTEGRAPVWGSEFTSKRRRTTGGGSSRNRCRLNVKMWLLTGGDRWFFTAESLIHV